MECLEVSGIKRAAIDAGVDDIAISKAIGIYPGKY